jgi:hypothetical protein
MSCNHPPQRRKEWYDPPRRGGDWIAVILTFCISFLVGVMLALLIVAIYLTYTSL